MRTVNREAQLFQVVSAFNAVRRLADFLDGGEEQADQDGDDGDDDEQLNEGKAAAGGSHGRALGDRREGGNGGSKEV